MTSATSIVSRLANAKNYYDVLGVPESASLDDINAAYKKLALRLHPDKCELKVAGQAFKVVAEAHECLSDRASKGRYDTLLSLDASPKLNVDFCDSYKIDEKKYEDGNENSDFNQSKITFKSFVLLLKQYYSSLQNYVQCDK
ncbi:MAG: hypothetical protein EZS28_050894 [Streblomastix strix]|uniref:J domain-containing protein n=1 Tax=Streblomastix strix TaxID=222440 RepID=A0A5J4T5B0_9EUKA|nr:MAG: hypothetical protein EZS28_050894 [Streblomastix strix]